LNPLLLYIGSWRTLRHHSQLLSLLAGNTQKLIPGNSAKTAAVQPRQLDVHMSSLVGAGIVERGIFDPAHVNEAAVYAAWACIVAAFYWTIARKHRPGTSIHRVLVSQSQMANAAETLHSVRICCLSVEHATFDAGVNGWLLLMLGLIMTSYALRYVFFGTRWGSNSSFAMVNMLFTSLCPARILLPCPDSNPANCHLTYPKLFHHSVDLVNSSAPSACWENKTTCTAVTS